MQLISQEVPLDFNLFLFGDDHEGSRLRHADGWGQLVEAMRSDYEGCGDNFGVDHGDIMEGIQIDDFRYDAFTVEGVPLQEMERAKKNRLAIKDKLICIMEGNHPLKLKKFGMLTPHVCTELGVKYGTWSAIIEYTHKGTVLFRHYATHGYESINSTIDDPVDRENSMLRSLRRKMQRKAGNTVLMSMGHTHKLLVYNPKPMLYITGEGGKIEQHYKYPAQAADYISHDQRWYVNTGSFYRTYMMDNSGYAEIAGYDPIELGYAIATIRGGQLQKVRKVVL